MHVACSQMGVNSVFTNIDNILDYHSCLLVQSCTCSKVQVMTHRSQWLAEGPGPRGIPGPLADIQDRPWVVQQCAAHIAADHSSQQQLLQYGVQVTGQYCQPSDIAAAAAPGVPHTYTQHACGDSKAYYTWEVAVTLFGCRVGDKRSSFAAGMPASQHATAVTGLMSLFCVQVFCI